MALCFDYLGLADSIVETMCFAIPVAIGFRKWYADNRAILVLPKKEEYYGQTI